MKAGLRRFVWLFLLAAVAASAQAADIQQSPTDECLALGRHQKDTWRVESATFQNAGFVPPANLIGQAPATTRAMCRVVGKGAPSAGSAIHFEVWLPTSDQWNGRLLAVGTGAFLGAVNYLWLDRSLQRGYATVSTDHGHVSESFLDTTWARGQPERVIDYGHRGQHVVAVAAKEIAERYYGRAAARAYYVGCSQGGRMGLVEAARYPSDFDGIVAGAPLISYAGVMASLIWSGQAAMQLSPRGLPASMTKILHHGVLKTCGSTSGRIEDPSKCQFDPATLRCERGQTADCLTDAQVDVARAFYAGPKDQAGGPIVPGLAYGSELDWGRYVDGGRDELPGRSWLTTLQNIVYQRNDIDPQQVELLAAVRDTQAVMGPLFDTSPDLSAFARGGGKLILYHGWADGLIPAQWSIDYVRAAVARMGADRVESFLRLFMVPGLSHCTNRDDSQQFGQYGKTPFAGDPDYDILSSLERWVESGTAPERITAATAKDNRLIEAQVLQKFDIRSLLPPKKTK